MHKQSTLGQNHSCAMGKSATGSMSIEGCNRLQKLDKKAYLADGDTR